jgi:hypothetical protein
MWRDGGRFRPLLLWFRGGNWLHDGRWFVARRHGNLGYICLQGLLYCL